MPEQATSQRLVRFRRVLDNLELHREEWTRAHPDMWVAVSERGIEGVASTQEELLSRLDAERLRSGELFTELLESNPPALAL